MIQHSHLKVEKYAKLGHKTCSKQACVVNVVTFNGLDKKTGLFAEMEQSHLSHKLFCKVHSGEFPTVIAMFEMTRARNQELEEQGEEEEEEERKRRRRGDEVDYEEEHKRDGYLAEMEEAVEESGREVIESRIPRSRNFLETSSVSLKRSSQLVRSDALSPTSITRHLVMESEEMKEEVETEKRNRNNGIGARERENPGNSREARDSQTSLREVMRDPQQCPARDGGVRRKSYTQSLDASSVVQQPIETLPVRLMAKQESSSSLIFRFDCLG